jgi:type I restriction enzyme S subunit
MAFKPDAWSDDGVPIIRIENLNGSPAFNCFEGAVEPRYHVTRGDLLFGWSGNRGTSFGPFLWWRDGLHYLNQHIFKLIDLRCDKAWLYWCLKAVTRTIEDEAHGIIGMVHVTRGKLGGVQIPTPPEEEQRAIGSFLDGQVAKLNELVARKRQLIEKLEEKRAALISRTIARGLPPHAALAAGINPRPGSRPSGTAWLGDVPGHWTVRPLMYLVEANRPIMYGIVLPGPDVDDGVPIVKGGDVKPGRLTLDNLCRTTRRSRPGTRGAG